MFTSPIDKGLMKCNLKASKLQLHVLFNFLCTILTFELLDENISYFVLVNACL